MTYVKLRLSTVVRAGLGDSQLLDLGHYVVGVDGNTQLLRHFLYDRPRTRDEILVRETGIAELPGNAVFDYLSPHTLDRDRPSKHPISADRGNTDIAVAIERMGRSQAVQPAQRVCLDEVGPAPWCVENIPCPAVRKAVMPLLFEYLAHDIIE